MELNLAELNLANFITLNGHGNYSEAMVDIPDDIYVLIPNEPGLEEGYSVKAPTGTFESIIYHNKIPVFSKTCKGKTQEAGWKLYKPGEKINNMNIGPFHIGDEAGRDAKTCEEYKSFTNGNGKLMKDCETSPECIVYVDEGVSPYTPMTIDGNNIFKVKICGNTQISNIFSKLKVAQEEGSDPRIKTPIVLIPFICNAKTSDNYVLDPIETKDESIIKLFERLQSKNTTTSPEHVKSLKLETQDTEEKEFRKELNRLIKKNPKLKDAVKKILGDDPKKIQVPIKVDYYKNSKYKISKLTNRKFEPINDYTIGDEILTFYKYSKTNISFNNENIEIKGSLKDERGKDVPLFFNVGGDIYKMELE